MPTESTFLLAGLFLLLAAAGWALGRFGERDELDELNGPPPPLNVDYLKGLNFLLNEQTDQALEHFLNMVRVDDKTIETHFALGSLFRRRGEVDRAIRIHQNIIARPDLDLGQRDQALYSLAQDYLKAGLLDRAENMLVRLASGSRFQVEALEQLCRIYEQEKEWQKAIDTAKKLEVLSGRSVALQIAHYFCELADLAVAATDFATARSYVKKSQSGLPRTMRGALTRAAIAHSSGDTRTALKLYGRVVEENSHLMPVALPRLVEIHREQDSLATLSRELDALIKRNPKASNQIAHTAVVNDIGGVDVIDRCVEEYIVSEPTLAELIDLQKLNDDSEEGRQEALDRVRAGLHKLARATPRHQCKECGFSSQQLLWQCPSCKDWETQRPFASVQFDSLLQRSGIIDY